MPKILIICPTFPPINTPDHHRVRISIPWFESKGWDVHILAVEPQYIEAPIDSILEQLPDLCYVKRVKAFSSKWTRKIGLGNLGYRSLWQLFRNGNKLIKKNKYDLIYFSTTVFPSMVLGRVWKRKFNIPFILDFQDPWRNDFYLSKPKQDRPPKFAFSHFLNSILERFTVPHCDGIISVSEQYPKQLKERYSINTPNSIITFSASKRDFEFLKTLNTPNNYFSTSNNRIKIIYIGVVPPTMLPIIEVFFNAISQVQKTIQNIDVYFLGTSYNINASEETPIKLLASKYGLSNFYEKTQRISHFEVLRLLLDANIVLVPGTIDEGYTASKIYNYILSQTTIIALTHVKSSVSKILKNCNTGPVFTFTNKNDLIGKEKDMITSLLHIIRKKQFKANTNWGYYFDFSDQRMAEKQIEFFKLILNSK